MSHLATNPPEYVFQYTHSDDVLVMLKKYFEFLTYSVECEPVKVGADTHEVLVVNLEGSDPDHIEIFKDFLSDQGVVFNHYSHGSRHIVNIPHKILASLSPFCN